MTSGFHINNKFDGVWCSYDIDGSIKETIEYKNGHEYKVIPIND